MWFPRPYKTRCGRGPTPKSYYLVGRGFDPEKFKRDYGEVGDDELVPDESHINKLEERKEFIKLSDERYACREVRRRMQKSKEVLAAGLELRRNKLRELLDEEGEIFQNELDELNKNSRKLEFGKKLEYWKKVGEKEENERAAFVQRKLKEQFMTSHDLLRCKLSHQLSKEVQMDQLVQMREKEDRMRKQKEEESIFAQLNEANISALKQAEEKTYLRKHLRECSNVEVLRRQMAAKLAQRQHNKNINIEELQLMKSEAEAMGSSEEAVRQKDEMRKMTRKKMLDDHLRMQRCIWEYGWQKEIDFDAMLEEERIGMTLQENEVDKAKEKERKKAEALAYMASALEFKQAESSKEKEMEAAAKALRQEEEARMEMLRRMEELNRSNIACQAREAQLQQIKCKADKKAKLAELQMQEDADAKRLVDQQQPQMTELEQKMKSMRYFQDLEGQIEYREEKKCEEREFKKMLIEKEIEFEKELKEKENVIFRELNKDSFFKRHTDRNGEITRYSHPPKKEIPLKKLPICLPKIHVIKC